MTIKLNVPENNLVSPSSWGSTASIETMLRTIWKNYGNYIKFCETNCKIPAIITLAFIAIESGGNPKAGLPNHVTQGLMQWNRNFAKELLEKEYAQGRLTTAEKQKLAEYGIVFSASGKTRDITNSDQLIPELNILIGCIILGQMIDTDWGTENGQIKMDRIIAVYNAGAYGDTGKKARSKQYKTALDLSNAVNTITSAYIKKMLGTNGAMHIAKQKGIIS